MNLYKKLSLLLILVFLSACATTKKGIEPVELFHPDTEIAKGQLKNISTTLFIDGPDKPIIAGDNYKFYIYDISSKDTVPFVATYPPCNGTVTKTSDYVFEFTIDGTKTTNIDKLEIIARSSTSSGSLPKAIEEGKYIHVSFNVEAAEDENMQESDFNESEKIRIQESSIDPTSDEPFFLVTYYGNLPAGKTLDQMIAIKTDPADILKEDKQIDANHPKSLKIVLDKNKIKGLDAIHVEAELLDPTSPSKRVAKINQGFLVTQTLEISKFKSLSTILIPWNIDQTRDEFGEVFANNFLAYSAHFFNPNNKPILIYGSSMYANIRFLASAKDIEKVYGPNLKNNPGILTILRDPDGADSTFKCNGFVNYKIPALASKSQAFFLAGC